MTHSTGTPAPQANTCSQHSMLIRQGPVLHSHWAPSEHLTHLEWPDSQDCTIGSPTIEHTFTDLHYTEAITWSLHAACRRESLSQRCHLHGPYALSTDSAAYRPDLGPLNVGHLLLITTETYEHDARLLISRSQYSTKALCQAEE